MSWQEGERLKQVSGHAEIKERGLGCSECMHFNGCHTAVWRKGKTCDLFNHKNN